MPLIACPECGTEVSRTAKACPRCGASARAISKGRPKKQIGLARKILIGGGVVEAVVAGGLSVKPPQRTQADAAADAQGQKRREATVADAVSLKAALRDPDSLVFEKILASDDGSLVCIRYRARNGFGGMDRGHAVFTNGGPGTTSVTAWNKHCAHVALNDESDTTIQLMKLLGH